jgi:hypothetical protein
MAQSNYLRRVNAINRNQGVNDVQRGMNIGQEVGKMLGGLSEAIKGAQQDALANKLMNTENAPRAALVSPGDATASTPGGPQPGGPQGGGGPTDDDLQKAMAADSLVPSKGTPQDLGTLPAQGSQPSLGINTDLSAPAPADTASTYTPSAADDTDFQNAIVAARLGGGPTVGNTIPASSAPAAPVVPGAPAAPSNLSTTTSSPTPNTIAPGVSTAGTQPYTGGVKGLSVLKEVQALQAQKAVMANTQAQAAAKLADTQAKASGTGPYALEAALKRAQLAKAQASVLTPKTAKPDKNAPPVNISAEPVDNQAQLTNFIDGVHGKGVTAGLVNGVSTGNETATDAQGNPITDEKGNPIIDPATGQPKVASIVPVQLGANKTVNVPIGTAQTAIKQQNALLKKQHQPLLRVPGEDQSLGSQTNPYPVKTKLDALSRASGTWVRLPTGQIAQVP